MDWYKKWIILISGFLEALLLSGSLFGWPSLLLILQEEGIYSNICQTRNHSGALNSAGGDYSGGKGQIRRTTLQANQPQTLTSVLADLEGSYANPAELDVGTGKILQSCRDDNGIWVHCPEQDLAVGCNEQRIYMTLIYTFAAVAYGITAVFIGLSLEKLGLRITRITGSLLGTVGFILLAFTTPENSYLLWFALNLLALGTNQLRLSGFQFADLLPKYRATVITVYSSAYSISTTFFLLIQLLYESHVSMRILFLGCAGIFMLTLIPTYFMPKMKIEPIDNYANSTKPGDAPLEQTIEIVNDGADDGGPNVTKVNGQNDAVVVDEDEARDPFIEKSETTLPDVELQLMDSNGNATVASDTNKPEGFSPEPAAPDRRLKPRRNGFVSAVCSLSGMLHLYWHFFNLFLILFYSSTFNIWAAKVTSSVERVSFYIKISGVCCLIAPLFVPVTGIVTDKMIQFAEMRPNRIERLAYSMQAPTFAMTGATFLLVSTMICKLFLSDIAIYASLVLIAMSRPMVVGSCTAYIRHRFPSKQFNILNGIFTTIISILCFVQYPVMKWMTSSDEAFAYTHWILLVALICSFASPIHMMFRGNILRFARARLNESGE